MEELFFVDRKTASEAPVGGGGGAKTPLRRVRFDWSGYFRTPNDKSVSCLRLFAGVRPVRIVRRAGPDGGSGRAFSRPFRDWNRRRSPRVRHLF